MGTDRGVTQFSIAEDFDRQPFLAFVSLKRKIPLRGVAEDGAGHQSMGINSQLWHVAQVKALVEALTAH